MKPPNLRREKSENPAIPQRPAMTCALRFAVTRKGRAGEERSALLARVALSASQAFAEPEAAGQGWRGTRHREAAPALTGRRRSGLLEKKQTLPRRNGWPSAGRARPNDSARLRRRIVLRRLKVHEHSEPEAVLLPPPVTARRPSVVHWSTRLPTRAFSRRSTRSASTALPLAASSCMTVIYP